MKTEKSSAIFLLVIPAMIIAGLALGQSKRMAPASKVTVMNPVVANKMAERFSLAPRPESLNGKTVYMVDINWGGSETAYSIFEEIQAWFAQHMPGVKTLIKIKRGGYDADDPALWKEIAQNGNAAILGVSG